MDEPNMNYIEQLADGDTEFEQQVIAADGFVLTINHTCTNAVITCALSQFYKCIR